MPAPRTILLTGAAGGVGTLMRELLPAYGYELRLLDLVPVEGAPDAITADAQNLYWANQTAVIKASNTGGSRVELASGNGVSSIAVDASPDRADAWAPWSAGNKQALKCEPESSAFSPMRLGPTSTTARCTRCRCAESRWR